MCRRSRRWVVGILGCLVSKSNGEVSNKFAGCAAGASTATSITEEDSTDADTDSKTVKKEEDKQTNLADSILQRIVCHLQRDVLRLQPVVELLSHQARYTQQLVRGQGVKHDNVVEAIEELRPEELLDL